MKKSLLYLCSVLQVASLYAADQLVVATWNAGMIDRPVSALNLSGFAAEIDADILVLNEVKTVENLQQIRLALGREDDFVAISSFENGSENLEVGIISRFPLAEVVEFDPTPENGQLVPEQRILERVNLPGIANVVTERGFLVARVPSQNLFVIATHLKSSRGATGNPDRSNAQKRELVAAAIATHVNHLLEDFPQATIFVLGDFNVGVSDANKNGSNLTTDGVSGGQDKYDETHALLKDGLIDDLRMKCLADGLPETFVGDDDVPDFVGSGAIDVIYVAGAGLEGFAAAKRASTRFGSDHRAVFTTSITQPAGSVVIKKLLPNPLGPDATRETITLENTGSTSAMLNGWRFRDASGNTFLITNPTPIPPGLTVITLTQNSMPLNNNGDTVVFLNEAGIQIGNAFTYTQSEVISGVEIVH
jgi:endonuclease/exonuclease/phosphatase family metal-dependent hydrolase